MVTVTLFLHCKIKVTVSAFASADFLSYKVGASTPRYRQVLFKRYHD